VLCNQLYLLTYLHTYCFVIFQKTIDLSLTYFLTVNGLCFQCKFVLLDHSYMSVCWLCLVGSHVQPLSSMSRSSAAVHWLVIITRTRLPGPWTHRLTGCADGPCWRTAGCNYKFTYLLIAVSLHCSVCLQVAPWLHSTALDLRSLGCGFSSQHDQLRNNLGQTVHTYVPLSPSSITWYWSKDGKVLLVGR